MRRGKKVCIALYIAAGVMAPVYGAMRLFPAFAEFFNNTVSTAGRRIFAFVSDIIPFSIAEAALLVSPVLLVLVIVWAVKRIRKYGPVGCRRVIAALLAVVCFIASSFVLNGSAGYFGKSVSEKMGFGSEKLTKEDLVFCAERLAEEINGAAESGVVSNSDGATVNTFSLGETARCIADSFGVFRGKYGFPQSFKSNPKILATSRLVTYTHMSGFFADCTGEISINVNYPHYVVVSTLAHEMAHQRGVMPEDEANFIAWAVLRESPFPYLRYSGALDAFTTVSGYLYRADRDAYAEVRGKLCRTAKDDLAAYSAFFDRYRDSAAAKVTKAVNDAYLKSQGTSGEVSYDESTYLIVKYAKRVYG